MNNLDILLDKQINYCLGGGNEFFAVGEFTLSTDKPQAVQSGEVLNAFSIVPVVDVSSATVSIYVIDTGDGALSQDSVSASIISDEGETVGNTTLKSQYFTFGSVKLARNHKYTIRINNRSKWNIKIKHCSLSSTLCRRKSELIVMG